MENRSQQAVNLATDRVDSATAHIVTVPVRHKLYESAESLQNLLTAHATGGHETNAAYQELRRVFLEDPRLEPLLPRFVRTCRTLAQFWEFIKHKFPSYHERRAYIWGEFQPILETLEKGAVSPSDDLVTGAIKRIDSAHVHEIWQKALERRHSDAEGAITVARTLLESVCKHILDELNVDYDEKADLPKLYKATAEALNLAPNQHTEQIFRQILGGCASIVEGLGSLRNKLSDSHGRSKLPVKPAPRHAELAVNIAGAVSQFLLSTWETRNPILHDNHDLA